MGHWFWADEEDVFDLWVRSEVFSDIWIAHDALQLARKPRLEVLAQDRCRVHMRLKQLEQLEYYTVHSKQFVRCLWWLCRYLQRLLRSKAPSYYETGRSMQVWIWGEYGIIPWHQCSNNSQWLIANFCFFVHHQQTCHWTFLRRKNFFSVCNQPSQFLASDKYFSQRRVNHRFLTIRSQEDESKLYPWIATWDPSYVFCSLSIHVEKYGLPWCSRMNLSNVLSTLILCLKEVLRHFSWAAFAFSIAISTSFVDAVFIVSINWPVAGQ